MLMLMMMSLVTIYGDDPLHQLDGVSVMRIQSQTATNHRHRLIRLIPLPLNFKLNFILRFDTFP